MEIGDRVKVISAKNETYINLTGTITRLRENTCEILLDNAIYNPLRGVEQKKINLYYYKVQLIEPREPNWEV